MQHPPMFDGYLFLLLLIHDTLLLMVYRWEIAKTDYRDRPTNPRVYRLIGHREASAQFCLGSLVFIALESLGMPLLAICSAGAVAILYLFWASALAADKFRSQFELTHSHDTGRLNGAVASVTIAALYGFYQVWPTSAIRDYFVG